MSKARWAQPPDSWLSGSFFRRQIKPQAAPSVGHPRPLAAWAALAGHIGLVFDMGVRRVGYLEHLRHACLGPGQLQQRSCLQQLAQRNPLSMRVLPASGVRVC